MLMHLDNTALRGKGPICRQCLYARALSTSSAQRVSIRAHNRATEKLELKSESKSQRKKTILSKYQEKVKKAAKEWQERAEHIAHGKARNLWDVFEERGYIKDVAGYDSQESVAQETVPPV